jgi:hypothetical protein
MQINIDPNLKPLPITDDSDFHTLAAYPHLVACDQSNWQIYANDFGRLASLAVVPGCKSTMFGDVAHIRYIMQQFGRKYTLTPYGAALIGERFLNYLSTL